MKRSFEDGAIVVESLMHQRTDYDVGNRVVNVQFDGRGSLSKYAVIDKFDFFSAFYTVYTVNGQPMDYGEPKKVVMKGRKMVTTVTIPQGELEIVQFLSDRDNAVFQRVTVRAKEDVELRLTYNYELNFLSYLEEFFRCFGAAKLFRLIGGLLRRHVRTGTNWLRNDVTGDFYVDYAASEPVRALERTKMHCHQFATVLRIPAGKSRHLDSVLSCGTRGDFSDTDVLKCLSKFDAALAEANAYEQELMRQAPDTDEHDRALYASCLNCALSNYKERGDFRGFLAGKVYQFPARTYYRDGYWTILPVLKTHPQLVRNEIMTLAGGIARDGKCPSAVKSNFKNYWGDHYDSPSFFVLMVYDYVAHTGDRSVLDAVCRGGMTVAQKTAAVMARLKNDVDETGLLVKRGPYNRRDWCDNVSRHGYVTYDEALYARALYCMAELDPARKDAYLADYRKAVESINRILWSEEKGYFVNYVDGDFVEDNLSIDTVPIALFDLTDEARKIRMLRQMEAMLESANNSRQKAGDFGVLSVYPFYRNAEALVCKSTLPYYYHNGGDWPYWSAAYAFAKREAGLDGRYPAERWFDYNLERGNYTPIEFFSPFQKDGSLMQAWSAMSAFALTAESDFFRKRIDA